MLRALTFIAPVTLGMALAFATPSKAQVIDISAAMDACMDFVTQSALADEGSGSQGYAAGEALIERTTAWNSALGRVDCRIIGLRHLRPVVLIGTETGQRLVREWIARTPGINRVQAPGGITQGCGIVDVVAGALTGTLPFNPYRPGAPQAVPVEITVSTAGTFCAKPDT